MKSYLLSRRMVTNVLVLGLLGVWYLTLGPTAFGGPAGYVEVSGHSMDGTYMTGDLILTRAQDSYQVGDIVTFKVNGNQQVIHRITGGDGVTGYTTQGDDNPDPDPWHPTDADVVGKSWHRFEGKAWMLHLPQRPWFIGMTACLLTLLVLGIDPKPRRRGAVSEGTLESEESWVSGEALGQSTHKVPAQRVDSTPARFRTSSAPPVEDPIREIRVEQRLGS